MKRLVCHFWPKFYFQTVLSHTVNTHKDHVNKRKEKGESLRKDISTVTDNLGKIKRDDSDVLIEAVKTAASASNYAVGNITERLRNISKELEGITFTNIDDILNDVDKAYNYFSVGTDFELAFELRPQHLTGLLFHVRNHNASFNVFLIENKVSVKVNNGNHAVSVSVTPSQSLCDGKFHMVDSIVLPYPTVSKKHGVINLMVDSMSDQRASPSTSYSTTLDSLYIGGITEQNQIFVSSPFVGCLRNAKVNVTECGSRKGSIYISGVAAINVGFTYRLTVTLHRSHKYLSSLLESYDHLIKKQHIVCDDAQMPLRPGEM
ncbi:hypothetical protein PAMA_001677 [Pampus argenteus]